MIGSQELQQQNDNEQSFEDENALQILKQEVCLSNHQLLELTHNDQKFNEKLKELNHFGCLYIQKMQFPQALVYLAEAQKILEYAASCGKTIERKLIITTLNNEASLYQKAWELQKAQSYLEAIIYNISSFFQNSLQCPQVDKTFQLTKSVSDQSSSQYQELSVSLWKQKSLIIFYLQYCAINSQNKNNSRAFSSAHKAVSLIKEISMDLFRYQKCLKQNGQIPLSKLNYQALNQPSSKSILFQLANFKDIDMKQVKFQKFYETAVKYIAIYMKRLKDSQNLPEESMEAYKNSFQNYSIGTIMQISPVELDQQTDRLDLKHQISIVQKHFKAVYLSVAHFILGTQARFIAAEKYSLDQNERSNSLEYKESQIYHLCSIIILTRFLLCQSGYFDHIVNSFRNHYKVNLMEDATIYLENHPELNEEHFFSEDDEMFSCVREEEQVCLEVEEIQKLESDVKTDQFIPDQNIQREHAFNIDTERSESSESSEQANERPETPEQKDPDATKSAKQSKNTVCTQNTPRSQIIPKEKNTAKKKSHSKKAKNLDIKGQERLHTQQGNKIMGASQHQHKNLQKAIHLLTSREKQNKMRLNLANQKIKASRSKGKSVHQFLSNNKKIHHTHDRIAQKLTQRKEQKRQTIYCRRQTDFIASPISRCKDKRMPTSNEAQRKIIKKKDSYVDLRKVKKVDEEYRMNQKTKNLEGNRNQIKTSRNNLNINLNNNTKKPKNRKESQEKKLKLTSPQIKFKKLKSPKIVKK